VKYCSFTAKADAGKIKVGRIRGDRIEELDARSMIDLILNEGRVAIVSSHDIDDVRLVAPIPNPSKIICVGLNYREHIKELGHQFPSEPVIFSKPSSAIIGPGDKIVLPKASKHIDYEGEIAIVIGKRAYKVKEPERFIFGYSCFNDVTARDIQRKSQDWTRAKGFDTFAPMGPVISTERPKWIKTYLNDRQVQSAHTEDMIFGFDDLVVNISDVMTLNPGDIIATGTPVGVGRLKAGDRIAVEADGIGRLENYAVDE